MQTNFLNLDINLSSKTLIREEGGLTSRKANAFSIPHGRFILKIYLLYIVFFILLVISVRYKNTNRRMVYVIEITE